MPMSRKGADKLNEELGEVQQVLGKLAALDGDLDRPHWDGKGPMRDRLEMELGDAMGAAEFVIDKMRLNRVAVYVQAMKKQKLFEQWDKEE